MTTAARVAQSPRQTAWTLESLTAEVQRLSHEINFLREQLKLKTIQAFGASSEATKQSVEETASLFNEAEEQSAPATPEPELETVIQRRGKSKGKRELQFEGLPTEKIRYELPEAERLCPCCARLMHEIGEEIRRELTLIPAQLKATEHARVKYACRDCANHGTGSKVYTAPMPTPAFPGGPASASLVAYLMDQKYGLGVPLYRQEQYLKTLGIDLSRQTMANLTIAGARWFEPVFNGLQARLKRYDILHADETRVQVLHEAGREASAQSFMWVYRSGRHGPPITLYEYQTSRAGEHPRRFLQGFAGYLHVDGYSGYNHLADITVAGCWAHARRGFDRAVKALPPGSRAAGPCASQVGLNFCNRLYKIERELSDLTPEERLVARRERCVPLLAEFDAWLNAQALVVLPKSALGQAIGYVRNQWTRLHTFLEDGRLEIDNNRCERAVKPFVIGRKNWLFSNTPKGANASASIYSIVETAKENGLRPAAYLEYLLQRLPNIDSDNQAALESLMPWSPETQKACK